MTPDWTVIGGGLAGTLLVRELARRGCRIRWIDDPQRPAATRVAAGMYNPITGKRFAKTWQVDRLQPFMETYYRDLERELDCRLMYPCPALKLFRDEDEKVRWLDRKDEPRFADLAAPLPEPFHPPGIQTSDLGGFVVPSAGFVRADRLIQAFRDHCPASVERQEGVHTPDVDDSSRVYCTGWHALHHPGTRNLPFRHAHGDVLTIEAEGLCEDYILNCGFYVLPLGNGVFRVGATYDWNRLDPAPTEQGREQLLDLLRPWITVPYKVMAHEAGIRCTTVRRTPILGELPDTPGRYIFNGLGSKGILSAPYYAVHLADHLTRNTPLDRDIDIRTHIS